MKNVEVMLKNKVARFSMGHGVERKSHLDSGLIIAILNF
jgi:hypothetical protein